MRRLIQRLILVAGLFIAVIYVSRRRIFAQVLGIRAAEYAVKVTHNLMIESEGVALATDHYAPAGKRARDQQFPTILIRCPYGRNRAGGLFGLMVAFSAHRYAERGYHVVVQDTRGRGDSGGLFTPFQHERADGLATVDWIQRQAWFNGQLATWGGSYLGIVQWAIADRAPIQAVLVSISSSELELIIFPDNALDLSLAMRWLALFEALDNGRSLTALTRSERHAQKGIMHLPMIEADSVTLSTPSHFFSGWLDHDDYTTLWPQLNYDCAVERVSAPIHLISGWYDVFLRGTLNDYHKLRAAGRQPYLTIGPWFHLEEVLYGIDVRHGLEWFDAHIKGHALPREKPIRLFVMGANVWRDYEQYPPESQAVRVYLHSGGALTFNAPVTDEPPDAYAYDPLNPTPIVGGAQLSLNAGRRDNRALESRADVLTYTSAPLTQPLEIVGAVRLVLHVQPSIDDADFYGRLTDVYPDGRSMNICDGLYRITSQNITRADDGTLCVEVDLWATAYQFKAGHRIRLIVSSGAHPHWARNLGVPDQLHSTQTQAAHQRVYHDPLHPSALILPIVQR